MSSQNLTVAQATTAAESAGVTQPTVVQLTNQITHQRQIEVTADLNSKPLAQRQAIEVNVTDALAKAAHTSPNNVNYNEVGATWGSEVTTKAIQALIVFFILVTIYISIRFEFKMAVAAIVAVLHDILITVGIYSSDRVPGHAGHGGRRPHRARVLALRHRRRLRPNTRQRPGTRARPAASPTPRWSTCR